MLSLYTETTFQPPQSTATQISVRIPRANGSYGKAKPSTTKSIDRLAVDEASYNKEYLASASAIFFHDSRLYPRSFLWRIRSNQTVLEIRSADFSRPENQPDADVVLSLEFQDAISPRGVAFTSSTSDSSFHLFVLTRLNDVYEFSLNHSFFTDSSSIPTNDLQQWCRPVRSSSLSIDTAYYMYASDSNNVFMSFVSGKIQWWTRDSLEAPWSQSVYDDKTWGASLLSIVSRKGVPDVDFDGLRLAHNTAHGMTRHRNYLFTLCINHTLRTWHLPTGKLVDSRDLLDVARDPSDRVQLNLAEPGYIQFLDGNNVHEQTLATYSPYQGGQVKFWRVRGALADDEDLLSVHDMLDDTTLSLPDPDPTGNSVWSLSGLSLSANPHTKKYQTWLMWRNHNIHKIYTLQFDFSDITRTWTDQSNWLTVNTTPRKTSTPDLVWSDQQDISSRWLEFFLVPGRYPSALLETALAQYQTATGARLSSNERDRGLRERLSLVVAGQVSLRRLDENEMDYERFAIDIDQQWRQFSRLVENLNDGRYAPLNMAYDPGADTCWVAMADNCCIVREASNLELLENNTRDSLDSVEDAVRERCPYRKTNTLTKHPGVLSVVLAAADKFTSSFSPELRCDFHQALDEDLYAESQIATPERIVAFFNQIDFANAVSDEAENALMKELDSIGGIGVVTDDLYHAVFQLLSDHRSRHGKPSSVKTSFGVSLASSALFDQISNTRQVLLNLLAIVIFLDGSENFNTPRLFHECVQRLRIQERNYWLATHRRRGAVSVLEDIYAHTLRPQSTEHQPLAAVLTTHVADSIDFISGDHYLSAEDAAVHLQCNLLKKNDMQLATEFSKFQPPTPWSSYIKGRLSLLLGLPEDAATYFRQSSYTLAQGKALGKLEELSAGLLTAAEASSFNSGLPRYFEHIVVLFQSHKEYTQAAAFAHLALQSLPQGEEPQPNFRQSLLTRLFNAQLSLALYPAAFTTLAQYPDPILQRTASTDLINAILNPATALTEGVGTLTLLQSLPWSAHPHLAIHLDTHLSSLAASQHTISFQRTTSLLHLTDNHHRPIDYLAILHALRLNRGDSRGAMQVLFDRLRLVLKSSRARNDPEATDVRHALLTLINSMLCVPSDERYIIVDAKDDPRNSIRHTKKTLLSATNADPNAAKPSRKKVVITLNDLRREYQKVLDRCSRIDRGDFGFDEDGEDEDDGEEGFDGGNESRLEGLARESGRHSGVHGVSNGRRSAGGDAMEL